MSVNTENLVEDLRSPSPVLQDAQDPLEGWTQMFPPWVVEPQHEETPLELKIRKAMENKQKRKRKKRSSFLKHLHNTQQSFVIKSPPKKGRRLIKIEIIDFEHEMLGEGDSPEDALLSAQYVVSEDMDQIMDQAENLINNISKKICGYSYSF